MRHMGQNEAARDGAVVFVAVELSKSAWLLASQASPSGKMSSHRLDGGDVAGLLALLRRLQARAQRADGQEVQVVLGYEAGYDGFWLQRRLTAEGITCWVMDPGSLQVDRRARRTKTDRLDAAMLLRALMAWCRGDRSACRMVQVPSVEREDARRTHRERQRLIAERVQHVNRIKGLLATQGIYDYQPLRRDRRERLDALRTGDGRVLPRCLRREIEREAKRPELVLEQIEAIEAERDAAVAAPAADDAGAAADAARVMLLSKLGGVGTELATVLVREALYRPFANRREVAAYAGLAPAPTTAATGTVTRASPGRATHSCARPWWSWPGCGCATNRTARWRAGSPSGSARSEDASARSPPSRWPGSCWSPCGSTSRPGWCPRGRV
jgi:transposase